MGLSATNVVQSQDILDISSTKLMTLGSYAETPDGRGFRYALAGAANLAPGKLTVAATVDANVANVTVAATVAAGESKVTIDAGAAVAANAYQDGTLVVNDATGEGATYGVASHDTMTASGEMEVTLSDPLAVGLTVDVSEVTLTKNPWAGAVISAVDQADMPVGVPNVAITAAYYGWIQTKGVCAVLADETLTIGKDATIGSSVAGSLEVVDALAETVVGTALVAGVDTEYRPIFLKID